MSNDTQVQAHIKLVEDFAQDFAKAHCERLYGTSESFTKLCLTEANKSLSAVEASARQLAEQPEGMKLVPASPTMEVRKHLEGKVGVDFLIAYADWCRPLTASPTAPTDPLEKLTRISEELGLYDDMAPAPLSDAERLSDDEIKKMRTAARDDPRCVDVLWYMLFARAIEAEVLRRGGGV